MAGNKPTTKIKNHKDDRLKGKRILTPSQNNSDASSSGSPHKSSNDLSVLHKSIPTSIIGFRQIRKLYDTATEEVQNLLTNECDFIYECRVCRNIFRSLANFLSHKRIYCKQKFNKILHAHFIATSFLNDDSTEMYFNTAHDDEKLSSRTGSSINSCKKDLTSIIDKLGHRDASNKLGLLEYYDEIKYRIAQKDAFRSEHAIRLDDIEGNNSAVFQTVVKKDDCDTQNEFMADEIIELHDMLWKENAVMGPDGKLLAIDVNGQIKEPKVVSSKFLDDEDDFVKCEICSLEFRTRKTLLYHIKSKHSTSHMHYPCPSCSDIFATAGTVYRHLCKVHNNTMVTVRKLRDQILNKGFTLDNASKKMLDRINKKSDDSTIKHDHQDESETWMLDFELDLDTLRCSGCGRKFERKAALTSHQLICKNRMQTQNKFVTNSVKKIVEDADNEEITRNSRKNKAPLKKIKNNKELNTEIGSTVSETQVEEIVPTTEALRKDDGIIPTSDNVIPNNNSTASLKISNKLKESSNEEGINKPHDIKVNKRKRQHTTRIINELAECSDDLYWEMNNDGSLSVKKPKEELADSTDTVTDDLKRKMFSLINEKKLQCIPCKKIFPSMTNLKRHIALHMKWKRFQCGLCSAQFYHRSECVYHLGRTHNMMGDKHFVDSLIIPMKPQESEIHIDNDFIASTDEETSKIDTESNSLNESQKNSIDLAIDEVVQKYTEHSSNSDEKDPLSNDDASASIHTESAENSDYKDYTNETDEPSANSAGKKDTPEITPVRKRGRPKSVFTDKSNEDEDNREKRGRGRPKGSLNKDKKKKSSPSKVQHAVDNSKQEADKPKDQDKMRKMVLEVIFGGDKDKKLEKEVENMDARSEDAVSPADTDVSCASTDFEIKTKFNDLADPNADSRSCRPIRNRVKVVNKDFVYDLSDLLKKEAEAYKESQYTMTYSRFKKRSNSVMHGEHLSKDCEEKNYQSTSVSPTNSMKWENTEVEDRLSENKNDTLEMNSNTLDIKNSEDEQNSASKTLCLFDEDQMDIDTDKDPLSEMQATEFKMNASKSYKPDESLEDITVIPVNISNTLVDDSCSSSDEMPLLEINMSQDVDSNDDLNDPLEASNIITSDPESSCPDITTENYHKEAIPPIQYCARPRLVNPKRSVLKPSKSQQIQSTEKSNVLNRVYIRKPSGDLEEIIFEAPLSINNSEESSTHTSLIYEPQENHITHDSEFELRNTESINMTEKERVLHLIKESIPLACDSTLEDSSSNSDLSEDDY